MIFSNILLLLFIFLINNNKIYSHNSNHKQRIISARSNNIYYNGEAKLFIDENKFLTNKKLITISPGGFKGFYLLGVLAYIKEKYDTSNLIYSGASAGAWNSLFMCYKGEPLSFVYNLLDYNIKKTKSITELEYYLKYKFLSKYKDSDFELNRLFIGVTTLKNFSPCINIISDFETLEDAINCCFASSHIPLITGTLTNKYHNMFTFDGGFSDYPYLDKETLLHITPSMWKNKNNNSNSNSKMCRVYNKIKNFSDFFSISKNNLIELFDDGYQDAKSNKEYLDTIFTPKTPTKNEND